MGKQKIYCFLMHISVHRRLLVLIYPQEHQQERNQLFLFFSDVTFFLILVSSQIHQARKLVCRKCKCQVTEDTGHVVCEGTRRYRMCTACIQEVGCDDIPVDGLEGTNEEPALLLGVDGEEEGDAKRSWMVTDDDDLAEDSGADLIIQQVDDSDEELQ